MSIEFKKAILFWFYCDVVVCENRLRLIRRFNPDVPIYGLYGGSENDFSKYERILSPLLDDLYSFPDNKSSEWKWVNGDLMIASWYRDRGFSLTWDTIFIFHWDTLIFDSLEQVFPELGSGEVLITGLTDLQNVKEFWFWSRSDELENSELLRCFRDHGEALYGEAFHLMACHFIAACLPREFLDRYCEIDQPELGVGEYRLPTYARAMGFHFCISEPPGAWWSCLPDANKAVPKSERTLLPGPWHVVPFLRIVHHLLRKDGHRLFHPFYLVFPLNSRDIIPFLLSRRHLQGAIKKSKSIAARVKVSLRIPRMFLS